MKMTNVSVGGTVEILASNDFQAIPIKVTEVTSDGIVKAGTPLTEAGAKTTGTGAVGILLYDVDVNANPNGAIVVAGIIDSVKAQAHSGVTYASGLYTALPKITFRTNIGVTPDEDDGE